MVVGPKELEKMTEDEERILKELEEKIDRDLYRDSFDENRYTVTIDGISVTRRVQKKIKEMYEKAGWKKVTFNSEQIGGDWIEFIK